MKCEHAKDAAELRLRQGVALDYDCLNLLVESAARECAIRSRGLCVQRVRTECEGDPRSVSWCMLWMGLACAA